MSKAQFSRDELERKTILQLLEMLSDSKRIQKAKTIKYTDIRIIFQTDEGRMYEIKSSTQTYLLRIDRKNRSLIHNCEDWVRRCIVEHKLCKHFDRIFQLLYEKDAKELLIDMCLYSWAFLDSDSYLKKG
jgi:hypothetical protein